MILTITMILLIKVQNSLMMIPIMKKSEIKNCAEKTDIFFVVGENLHEVSNSSKPRKQSQPDSDTNSEKDSSAEELEKDPEEVLDKIETFENATKAVLCLNN